MPVRSVAILGPGLIGGSLVLALHERQDLNVSIWARRNDALNELRQADLQAKISSDLAEVVHAADLVILATPVETMASLATQVRDAVGSRPVLLTDVGSVKASVVREVGAALDGSSCRFLGSHPMAGSELAGFEAARAELFDGAPCVLTPVGTSATETADLEALRQFWGGLGCRVAEMSPDEHDIQIALISHLPHVVASLLTDYSLGTMPESAKVAGSGFRDTTRIAAGDPDLWVGILRQNREATVDALGGFRDRLSEVLAILDQMDDEALRVFLAQAQELRQTVS